MKDEQLALVLSRIALVYVKLHEGTTINGVTYQPARVNSKVFRRM